MPIFRRLHARDLTAKYLGKAKRFHLTRNEGSVRFSGTLLALYQNALDDEEYRYTGVTRVDLLALFRTKSGRFLAYYAVDHEGNEHICGRREYLKVCESFEQLQAFVGRMRYVNVHRFQAILDEARRTLSPFAPQAEPVLSPPPAGA